MNIYYQKTEESKEIDKKGEEIKEIEVNCIFPNPNQPRKIFTDDSIIKLADSIKQYGLIQPLVVRENGDFYELISGERRLRAAKELNLQTVPCVVKAASDCRSAEMSIIENLLREDLNVFEQASAIETLIDTYGLTQEQVAKRLSNSQSFVANKLRLLRLNNAEREKILLNNLTERHARALLRIYDEEIRMKVLDQIVEQGLNVSKTDELIDKITSKKEANESKYQVRYYKDIKSFYVAINRAIDTVLNSGIKVKSRKVENDNFTEITILVPKDDSEITE